MRGMAIGRAIHNKCLYRWIVSIREKFGGKIVEPKNALREGIGALRKGVFLGIVGDQGKPDSGYAFPFFGRRAWTSTAPAFLSYRTHSPILFAETRRVKGGYRIRYSDPIWPDRTKPMEDEIPILMDKISHLLQESIRRRPGEWLWQHKRWKQPSYHNIRPEYSEDSVCIILPPDLSTWIPHLTTFKQIYEFPFLALMVHESNRGKPLIDADETIYYRTLEETLLYDYRFKLIFNFTDFAKIGPHYKKLSAFKVIDLPHLKKAAQPQLPEHCGDPRPFFLQDVFQQSHSFLRENERAGATLADSG